MIGGQPEEDSEKPSATLQRHDATVVKLQSDDVKTTPTAFTLKTTPAAFSVTTPATLSNDYVRKAPPTFSEMR